MSGLSYVMLEVVKLLVVLGFKVSPVDAKNMLLLSDITKLVVISVITLFFHGCTVVPKQVPTIQPSQIQIVQNF